jgi:uncharacterized protein YndB with AHSA1/START domain
VTRSGEADAQRLRIELLLPASIDDVYAAWTEPEAMARWLSPVGHAEVDADVRVGGRFRVVMVGGDVRIEHTGEYLTVDPPRVLSFTWRSPYTGNEPSVVTVSLTAEDERTRLVLEHERLPDGAAESHREGWGSILENLAAELQKVP